MIDAVLFITLVLAAAAAVLLGRSALRYWWAERTGRDYELPVDRFGALLRTAAAASAALLACAVGMPLFWDGTAAAGRTLGAAASGSSPGPAVAPSDALPPRTAPRTLGVPAAGGTLQELPDGTRVWLPPQYGRPRAARLSFPVVVAHLPSTDPELFEGFVMEARRGLSDPFLLVIPRDCDAGRDPAALLATVARYYRVLPERSGHAVIGVGGQAGCAVREAFAHPGAYRAAAALSGPNETVDPHAYDRLPVPTARQRPAVLIASVAGDAVNRAANSSVNGSVDDGARSGSPRTPGQSPRTPAQSPAYDAALRQRTELRSRTADVRVLDHVSDRRELMARVAGYLTEKLDGPGRV